MKKTLIRDGAVLTPAAWLEPGYLLIEDGVVREIRQGRPPADLIVDEVIDAGDKAVIPGLVNNHTHLSQTFMRGLAGGRTLISWLKDCIWPLQGALTPEDMRLATLLGLIENIHCGVTHMVDHHKVTATEEHTDAVLQAASEAGIHFTLARSWVDRGTNAEKPEVILKDLQRLFEQWHDSKGMLQIASGPLATWRATAETLRQTQELVKANASFTHIHVSENQDEVQMCLDDTGLRPVEWLDSIGLLDECIQIVHAVWVEDSEIRLMVERNATLVHCPISNAVLASGIAPLKKFIQQNAILRLGSDGSASADNQDLWEVIKSALLFSRASTLDASYVTPRAVLTPALSRDGFEKGCAADLCIVNLKHVFSYPVHDVTSALVLCIHGCDVDTVMVGGKLLMKDREIQFLDEEKLLSQCQSTVRSLRNRAGI